MAPFQSDGSSAAADVRIQTRRTIPAQPLTRLTIQAQKAVQGELTWPSYAVNVMLHAAVSLLLFALALLFSPSQGVVVKRLRRRRVGLRKEDVLQ